MATSNSTNYSTTRDNIIKRALRIIGAIGSGETPTTQQVNDAAEALEMMIKAFMSEGMPLWKTETTTQALSNATNSYTLSTTKPNRVIRAWLRYTSGSIDVPINIISRDQYERLTSKTSTGYPNQLWYEPLRTTGVLHVWPTPDTSVAAAVTLYYTYQKPFDDFDSSTNEPDFPQEWFDALCFGLAARLAPEYGLPLEERALLWKEAEKLKADALFNNAEEGSVFFGYSGENYR